MSGVSVQQMADRVAELMEERLRVRGDGLPAKLRRGGRFLPRKVRAQAAYLAEAAARAQVPRLQLQIDHTKVTTAYDTCVRHLKPLGRGARRRALALDVMTSLAAVVLVTGVLVLAVLVWRGFL
jgi:hypothetical protein